MRKDLILGLLVFWGLTAMCSSGLAQTLGLDIGSGGGPSFPNSQQTLGWSFTLTQPRLLVGLAIWDESDHSLYQPHLVGLWTPAGGTPFVTATVSSNSTIYASQRFEGQWLGQSLASPILLQPGDYVLGADYTVGYPSTNNVDMDLSDVFNGNTGLLVSTDPALHFDSYRYTTNPTAAFDFPDAAPAGDGAFGPNIILQTPVPEPGILAMLTAAAALVIHRSRRQLGVVNA